MSKHSICHDFSNADASTAEDGLPVIIKAGSSFSPQGCNIPSKRDYFNSVSRDASTDIIPAIASPALTAHGMLPVISPGNDSTVDHEDNALDTVTVFDEQASGMEPSLHIHPPRELARKPRLPSFHLLGIAAPHPDLLAREPQRRILLESYNALMPLPDTSTNTDSESEDSGLQSSPSISRQRIQYQVATLTPPAESPFIDWTSCGRTVLSTGQQTDTPGGIQSTESPTAAAPSQNSVASSSAANPYAGVDRDWLEGIINAIIKSINSATLAGGEMKVLSHALPSPSLEGHRFSMIIERVNARLTPNPLTWVNILHAVRGNFNLEQLPTSPPSTPGAPLGVDVDYFTSKTFESAVAAINYDDATVTPGVYRPLTQPESVNLAIVERYIPPTSANEFHDLFSVERRSLLVDRLVELSPDNGCIVFIYPTYVGARTFGRDYLGPALDPVIRSTMVIHNVSADFGRNLGTMPAINHMFTYETLVQRTQDLCAELNGNSPKVRQRLHGRLGKFAVEYAEKHEVVLPRAIWTDWWIRQEKQRIRTLAARYLGLGVRTSEGDQAVTRESLAQELLEGLSARAAQRGEVESKIEVVAIVIKRLSVS